MVAAGMNVSEIINYQQWRFAWYSFLDLLEIDCKAGFSCDSCGQYPEVLTSDATSLGFKKTFLMRSEMLGETNSNQPLRGR